LLHDRLMAGDPGMRLKLTVDEARALAVRALRKIGYGEADAAIIADHVVDAELCGYEYSGLAKILNIPDERRFALPATPLRTISETAVSALLDGGNQIGMVASRHATQLAIGKAQASGFAIVGIGNSWMSGRIAYYAEMAARADLFAIFMVSSTRRVAPPGGTQPVLGTNPIAFACPTGGEPLVLDIGTSAIAGSDVLQRMRLGEPLPAGVAIDADGRPTVDAARARRGALLSFGGYKGFGLGLINQMFGLLAGSWFDEERENSTLIIAFKPELLGPAADYKQRADALLARIKAIPRQEGASEIRVPSERSQRARAAARRDGIAIDRVVYDKLMAL
jgi:LDH2 family malate/lactate/ureidoglycolate dehydrogenase